MEDNKLVVPVSIDNSGYAFRVPKRVATIKLCGGGLTFYIDDNMQFKMPTEEQRENLKKLFCIEVIPEEEAE